MKFRALVLMVFVMTNLALFPTRAAESKPLRIAVFQADVTPPIGAQLCHGSIKPAERIVDRLSARGMILWGRGEPVVICSFDWVGISNEAHDDCRQQLASAVGTSVDRVTVHVVHQHDAPGIDFSTEKLLKEAGLSGFMFDPEVAREALASVAQAAGEAAKHPQPVTHIGTGTGMVKKVASNRRILGEDGKVAIVRYSSSRNPDAIAAPEGVIDPKLQLIAFWNGKEPVAALTHYATHPQSYYGQGGVSYDFPGMARAAREKALPGVKHIHFTGGGGNIGAGKYNNGSPEVRPVLAQRLEAGMKAAWDSQKKRAVSADDLEWRFEPVALPVRKSIDEDKLAATLNNSKAHPRERTFSARSLVFKRRMESGHRIPINCLKLAGARILYLPGELFVEYQLAAQKLRPDLFIAMAAYGDGGPGYIGTEVSYSQGGYETGRVSRVEPGVEKVLLQALGKLLEADRR